MTAECCAPSLDPTAPLTTAILFGTGVAVSLAHCLGMCGPIVLAFGVAQRAAGRAGAGLAPPVLVYHAGRLASYAIIGAGFGLAGALSPSVVSGGALRATLSIVAALLLLVFAFDVPGRLFARGSSQIATRLRRSTRRLLAGVSRRGHFGLGIANGFLPCGPVVAVAAASVATGGPLRGAASLVTFGLGTLPALAIVTWGAGALAPTTRRRFRYVANALLLFLAAQLALRGLAGLGWIPHLELGKWMLW